MEKYDIKPNYGDKDEIYSAIGKILWGNKGKKYSLLRLFLALLKKKRDESKNES